MSYNQRQTIYVADPIIKEEYGTTYVEEYQNLREYKNITVVSKFGGNSLEQNGNNITKTKNIMSDYPIEVSEDSAIYLTKPELNENGNYPLPEYKIASTIERFNNKVIFEVRQNGL